MLNLKNDHLELVKELPSFDEERYHRSLVAMFSGEYTTEKFNEKFAGYLENSGSVSYATKSIIDDYLVLTSEHPSDNANALFDIPLMYLLFNHPKIATAMSPSEIIEMIGVRRANATIYDSNRVYTIIVQRDLITDSFCRAYSYSGDFAIDAAPLIHILNITSFNLMEKMNTEQKIAIIKHSTELALDRIYELYKSGFSIEAPITPLELLQKISKSVEKELVFSGEDSREKRLAVMWVYLMKHGYSFKVSSYVLNELILMRDKRAYVINNETLFTGYLGEAILSTALTLMKNMFRALRGRNVNKYELHSIMVSIKDDTPVRDAMNLLLGEGFISEFGELVEEIGKPPFDREKTEYLINKHFDLKTLEPQKALSFIYLNGGAGGAFITSFELYIIQNSFSLARKGVTKEIGLKHLSDILAEDVKSVEEAISETDGLQLLI